LEQDLESACVAHLQQFLSELGSDFCFVARQFARRIDDDEPLTHLPSKLLLSNPPKTYGRRLRE